MDGLRRQALASVIDSAPFAVGARVLVQMPAIPSDYQRFYQRICNPKGRIQEFKISREGARPSEKNFDSFVLGHDHYSQHSKAEKNFDLFVLAGP